MSANLIPAIHALALARNPGKLAHQVSVSLLPVMPQGVAPLALDAKPETWAARVHLGPGSGWDTLESQHETPEGALQGLYRYYLDLHQQWDERRQSLLADAQGVASLCSMPGHTTT